MFVPKYILEAGNLGKKCAGGGGGGQKKRCLAENSARVAAGMEFRSHDQILEKVDTFKHLVQMLYFDDIEFTSLVRNLQRVWSKCVRFYFLLI